MSRREKSSYFKDGAKRNCFGPACQSFGSSPERLAKTAQFAVSRPILRNSSLVSAATEMAEQKRERDLVRGIRKWDLVAVAINGIIGAGIFGLPAKVYALIGTYSLIAFVACAIVVTLIILCFAEVGSRFDETGGPYLYAR